MNSTTLPVLTHLARLCSVTVGDNSGRLAAHLGLGVVEFERACRELAERGLARMEGAPPGVYRLILTDAGLSFLRKNTRPDRRRRWWQLWHPPAA